VVMRTSNRALAAACRFCAVHGLSLCPKATNEETPVATQSL
jgi:hypothetical protein